MPCNTPTKGVNVGDQHLVSPFNIIVLSSGGYVAYRQKSKNFGADHLTSEGVGGGGGGGEAGMSDLV